MLEKSKAAALSLSPPLNQKSRVRAASVTMLRQSRRLLWRSRGLVYSALISIFVCSLLLRATSSNGYSVIPWSGSSLPDSSGGLLKYTGRKPKSKDYNDNLARWLFSKECNDTALLPGADAIYGNAISSLTGQEKTLPETEAKLKKSDDKLAFDTTEVPYEFNPYPDYNSDEWKNIHRADFVPCEGPFGRKIQDVQVFKGHPEKFPAPSLGSFEVIGIDPHLSYERNGKLGQYGLQLQWTDSGKRLEWTKSEWGRWQQECVEKNRARFESTVPSNWNDRDAAATSDAGNDATNEELRRQREASHLKERHMGDGNSSLPLVRPENPPEARTAVLLRSYTGRVYTDNEKQVMRSLISELSLRAGGEYQVFLLVQVKDNLEDLALWDKDTYKYIMQTQVPKEFHDIAILWGGYEVQEMYPLLEKTEAARVHNAQWLSVQKFMQEHPEFEYVWNWEMDSRVIGSHYDWLNKIEEFAKKQPRKGLWERNERYYIPAVHGDYNTEFREYIEKASRGRMVWGAPDLPFIAPTGPKPPVSSPAKDGYEWGIGEEADYISLSPMFNPVDSNWILRDQVWQYNDTSHPSKDLPRRATIITQARLSRRLLEAMHQENKKGNHVGSEMAPGTVALLHGLKAVYAPMPVFMDRPFPPESLMMWFNPGPGGVTGGPGSPTGWGLEHRFQGVTWYFRAVPPQRMYNNWMGYEDAGIGGKNWEQHHGRPILPPMFLHPIKDVMPTWPGYTSSSDLPYNWWDDFRPDEEKAKDKKKNKKTGSKE